MALPLTVESISQVEGYNPPHKGPAVTTATYYFDASDAGPTDTNTTWTGDSNAFDGSISTAATCTNNSSSNTLEGTGTTSPTSGNTIYKIRGRIYGAGDGTFVTIARVYDTDGGTQLAQFNTAASSTPVWGSWVDVAEPSGGWTWTKIAALHTEISAGTSNTSADARRVEIEVTYSTGSDEYYFVTGNASNAIDVEKTSNPATTASSIQDGSNAPTESPANCLASISDGVNIHVVCIDGTNLSLEYSRFSMISDTWEITDDVVADLSGMSAPSLNSWWCSIELRPGVTNDEIVIAGGGLSDSDMGNDYQRVDFWHGPDSGTPSWTGPVSIDASVAAVNEYKPQLGKSTNNSVLHVFWRTTESPDNLAKAVSIKSDNTLSTIQTLVWDGTVNIWGLHPISYDDSGTGRIAYGLIDSTSIVNIILSTEDASDFVGTLSNVDNISNTSIPNDGRPLQTNTLVDSNNDLFLVWPGGGQAGGHLDLYWDTSTDNGSTWGTDVEELDGVTVNFISVDILDDGKIAYLYDDGGVTKYNEISLSSDTNVNTNLETLILTENQATVSLDINISSGTDALIITERTATVDLIKNVNANTETLTLSEQAATITYDVDVLANTEILAFTEQTSTISNDIDIATNLETLTLTEQQASISLDVNVSTNTEVLVIAEQQASVVYDVNVNANTSILNISEQQSNIDLGINVLANTETLTLTEQAAIITYDVNVNANTESLVLTEQTANIVYDIDVLANTETLILTEQQANISFGGNVLANTETLTLTEQSASISLDVNINANTESLILTEQQASVANGINVLANTETLVLNEQPAAITLDIEVLANTEVLAISEQPAIITFDVEILANTATLNIVENTASIASDVDIQAALLALTLTELPASITTSGATNINANTANLVLTENQAIIDFVGTLNFNNICEWVFSKAGYVGTCDDRLYLILKDKGYTQKQINDRFYAYLDANGWQGNLSDKISKAIRTKWLWQQ